MYACTEMAQIVDINIKALFEIGISHSALVHNLAFSSMTTRKCGLVRPQTGVDDYLRGSPRAFPVKGMLEA